MVWHRASALAAAYGAIYLMLQHLEQLLSKEEVAKVIGANLAA